MAIVFSKGFKLEEFDSTPVWSKKKVLAKVPAGEYTCKGSAAYPESLQVSLTGYKGFFTTPNGGRTMLTGNIEIWECVCERATDYCVEGEISQRAFEA